MKPVSQVFSLDDAPSFRSGLSERLLLDIILDNKSVDLLNSSFWINIMLVIPSLDLLFLYYQVSVIVVFCSLMLLLNRIGAYDIPGAFLIN